MLTGSDTITQTQLEQLDKLDDVTELLEKAGRMDLVLFVMELFTSYQESSNIDIND